MLSLLNQRERICRQIIHSKNIPGGQIGTLIDRFLILMATDHSVANICRQKGISRMTYYRRLNNYTSGGLPALLDKPRKPLNRSGKEILLSEIRRIALSDSELGCREISDQLKREGIKRCFKTINNILRKEGLGTKAERIKYISMRDRESEIYQ